MRPLLLALLFLAAPAFAQECNNWQTRHPAWIWCDDFETNNINQYFEHTGPFARQAGVGLNGSFGMTAPWTNGTANAGDLKLAFGATPPGSGFTPPSGVSTSAKYTEVYYRAFLKSPSNWVNSSNGNNSKFTRAMVVTAADWSQAMIAHLWSDENDNRYLLSDPVNCVTGTTVRCVGYNDFSQMQFLGAARGSPMQEFAAPNLGEWLCIEHRVKLNDPGQSNGISQFWVNDVQQANQTTLNYVASYTTYAINGIFFENFINNGSPATQSRWWDNIVVSTERIGCSIDVPPTYIPIRRP